MAVDDRPIASGLITQDVLANISIGSHSETWALAVVAVSYPIILGLDWLQHHNPNIDWHESHLTLNCCGLNPANPTKVYTKGFGPPLQPNSVHSTSVGLGLGLSIPVISLSYLASPVPLSTPPSQQKLPVPSSAPCVSFLSVLVGMNGFSCSFPSPLDPSPSVSGPPNVKIVSPRKFTRLARGEEVCYLHFHNTSSPVFINLFATDPPPPDPDGLSAPDPPLDSQPDPMEDFCTFVPGKYWPWADTVFNLSEFDKLPEH
jgi:hypothetical protein